MGYSYSSKLCFYKSPSSVMEPFEAVVILDLSKDCFWLNRSFTEVGDL